MLKELVQKLAERRYQVIRVFLAVADQPLGCETLHRLRIIANLEQHARRPETNQMVSELVARCFI